MSASCCLASSRMATPLSGLFMRRFAVPPIRGIPRQSLSDTALPFLQQSCTDTPCVNFQPLLSTKSLAFSDILVVSRG